MSKKTETTIFGTHARLILSHWKVLASMIAEHATRIKEISETDEITEDIDPHVLSQREIDDALQGPMQAFFKEKAAAYAVISRLRLHLTMKDDETFKEKRAVLAEEDKIPEHILSKFSISDLNKLQKTLDELTETHYQQWEDAWENWNDHMLKRFAEINLKLSDIEIKAFDDPEPISELLDRFIDLNIELPKSGKDHSNFSTYLTLKADITIHSALSRQHLPNTQSDIDRILKQLKSDFHLIKKQENELLEKQKEETQAIIVGLPS